jgi:hypothetical protein
MSHHVMIFGAGDVGSRIAEALLLRGSVRELTLTDLPGGQGERRAEMLASCYLGDVNFEGVDGLDRKQVEQVIRRHKPDLIVQAAALRSPFEVLSVDHPIAHALHRAGMAVQLGYQFPILHSVMESVKEVAPETPVANVSFPDLNHHLLAIKGLAPQAGLANTGIIHMRILTNIWRQTRTGNQGDEGRELPRVRVIGGHAHVYDVLFGHKPDDPDAEPLVYLGDEGKKNHEFSFIGENLEGSRDPNMTTSAAALPVVEAMLPGAGECHTSMAGPCGMVGGYPVTIRDRKVALDLPRGVSREAAEAFNLRAMTKDGVEKLDPDGTVHYTDAAKDAMSAIEPGLTESYNPLYDRTRTAMILRVMDRIRTSG